MLALLLAGCGGSEDQRRRPATLLLDFAPNAVHAGIFSAAARGYDRQANVRLRVRAPAGSADGLKLLLAGRADLAVLDIHDIGLARERGADVVGVMAIVQRPLAAVIARPGISTARALEGRRVGVTGVPSDDAVLSSIVSGAGGSPAAVRKVTIGFNAVSNLLGGRVAGATAFWNAEGVALARRRPGFRVFRVDELGAPSYPELVITTTRATLRAKRDLIASSLSAIARGYRFTREQPDAAVRDLQRAEPALDVPLTRAQLAAVMPAFSAGTRHFGELDAGRLRAWAAWDVRFGILRGPPDLSRAFDGSLVPR